MPEQLRSIPYYSSPDSTKVVKNAKVSSSSFKDSCFYQKLYHFGSKIKSFVRLFKHKKRDMDVKVSSMEPFDIESCFEKCYYDRTIISDVSDFDFLLFDQPTAADDDFSLIWSSELFKTDYLDQQEIKEIEEKKKSQTSINYRTRPETIYYITYESPKFSDSESECKENLRDADKSGIILTDIKSKENKNKKSEVKEELEEKKEKKEKKEKTPVVTKPTIHDNLNTFSSKVEALNPPNGRNVSKSASKDSSMTTKKFPSKFTLPSIALPEIETNSISQSQQYPQTQIEKDNRNMQTETQKQDLKKSLQTKQISPKNEQPQIRLQIKDQVHVQNRCNSPVKESFSEDEITFQADMTGSKSCETKDAFLMTFNSKNNYANEIVASCTLKPKLQSSESQVNFSSKPTVVMESLLPSTISINSTNSTAKTSKLSTPINRSPQLHSCTNATLSSHLTSLKKSSNSEDFEAADSKYEDKTKCCPNFPMPSLETKVGSTPNLTVVVKSLWPSTISISSANNTTRTLVKPSSTPKKRSQQLHSCTSATLSSHLTSLKENSYSEDFGAAASKYEDKTDYYPNFPSPYMENKVEPASNLTVIVESLWPSTKSINSRNRSKTLVKGSNTSINKSPQFHSCRTATLSSHSTSMKDK